MVASDDSLAGRVVLVTGGAGGLGSEIARGFARRGARVAVSYASSREPAVALAAELGGIAVGADVAREEEVAAMVEEVERGLGPVDVLVNNAGITVWAPYDDLDALAVDDWRRILDVNLIGAFVCIRAVARGMRERGSGSVVNVASESAFTATGSSLAYAASKAGLVLLTRALANALAPAVRVNAVAPAWMDTPWLDRYVPAEQLERLRRDAPTVSVGDVAARVVTLAAGAETGEVVRM